MKVTTDACLFGAWVSAEVQNTKKKSVSAIDIGCGTGLLSLMLAQKNNIAIDAVEIDSNAAEQAKENVSVSPWHDQIHVHHTDVLSFQTTKQYDCIFSNPPFYESELRSARQQKNMAHHDEGLTLNLLFPFIQKHLADDGNFFLLLPTKREKDFENLLVQFGFFLYKKIAVRQTVKHAPFRLLLEAGKKQTASTVLADMSIKNESNEYTPAFVELLKDYYLYL
ncbi:MAG: methyltransferase domain-containing protein [Chitinophagaceae bacterium]|nr:MAG: methyltransferase domain-containing protein [Chitinophagaceae bacterium]